MVLGQIQNQFALLEYGGQPYSIAFVLDITEHKQAEAHARREHREILFAKRVLHAVVECEGG